MNDKQFTKLVMLDPAEMCSMNVCFTQHYTAMAGTWAYTSGTSYWIMLAAIVDLHVIHLNDHFVHL